MSRHYTPSPAMQRALDAIAWRTPAIMIRCRKDAARRILAGGPCTYVGHRPLQIAQRYIRFLAHVKRRQQWTARQHERIS